MASIQLLIRPVLEPYQEPCTFGLELNEVSLVYVKSIRFTYEQTFFKFNDSKIKRERERGGEKMDLFRNQLRILNTVEDTHACYRRIKTCVSLFGACVKQEDTKQQFLPFNLGVYIQVLFTPLPRLLLPFLHPSHPIIQPLPKPSQPTPSLPQSHKIRAKPNTTYLPFLTRRQSLTS